MENIAQSQNALLPIYTINTQSVVLHELVNEFCHIITGGERERKGRRGKLPSEGCLGSAVSCLLF